MQSLHSSLPTETRWEDEKADTPSGSELPQVAKQKANSGTKWLLPNMHACLSCSQISITPPTFHDTPGHNSSSTWRASPERRGHSGSEVFFTFWNKIDTIKDSVQQDFQNRSTDIWQRSSPVGPEDQSLAYVGGGGVNIFQVMKSLTHRPSRSNVWRRPQVTENSCMCKMLTLVDCFGESLLHWPGRKRSETLA